MEARYTALGEGETETEIKNEKNHRGKRPVHVEQRGHGFVEGAS